MAVQIPHEMFQSPPASKGGCNAGVTYRALRLLQSFNPHPPRKAGAMSREIRGLSIGLFQSPPASKGGCNAAVRTAPRCRSCFNPHPPRKAGAMSSCPCAMRRTKHVSIPTRLERRVQWNMSIERKETSNVSIPTRLERRVQSVAEGMIYDYEEFQSPPASKGGCNGNIAVE